MSNHHSSSPMFITKHHNNASRTTSLVIQHLLNILASNGGVQARKVRASNLRKIECPGTDRILPKLSRGFSSPATTCSTVCRPNNYDASLPTRITGAPPEEIRTASAATSCISGLLIACCNASADGKGIVKS